MKIENRTELKEYRIECQTKQSANCRVLVCGGTGCLASGSGKIYEKLKSGEVADLEYIALCESIEKREEEAVQCQEEIRKIQEV